MQRENTHGGQTCVVYLLMFRISWADYFQNLKKEERAPSNTHHCNVSAFIQRSHLFSFPASLFFVNCVVWVFVLTHSQFSLSVFFHPNVYFCRFLPQCPSTLNQSAPWPAQMRAVWSLCTYTYTQLCICTSTVKTPRRNDPLNLMSAAF